MEENSTPKSDQQYDTYKSVGGKERGIQASEIVCTNESMLVNQQRAGCHDSCKRHWSKTGKQE